MERSGRERVLVLVKALPHVGKRYGETVCCAGVTTTGEWRRQFPVRFRTLKEKFTRWQWIEYDWRRPKDDFRPESRRVQEETIQLCDEMPKRERASFLDRVIVPSTEAAAERKQTLALVRPVAARFSYKKKAEKQLDTERRAYAEVGRQGSFLDKELIALEPCPYAFCFQYTTEDGKLHKSVCDDWETAAMYYNLEQRYGEASAIRTMHKTFNEDYPTKGMALALGTHSRFPSTWLLVGVIRVDSVSQPSLPL